MSSAREQSFEVRCATSSDGWKCSIKIHGDREYGYVVEVSRDELKRYGRGWADASELVSASFRFLLDHEPAGSILAHFSISAIERYFPEFRNEIARYLSEAR